MYRSTTRRFWRGHHVLYRCYNAAGELLYIGISYDISTRLETHKRTTPWFHEVDRIVCKLRPARTAYADEAAAIRTELPRYNIKHYPGREQSPPVRKQLTPALGPDERYSKPLFAPKRGITY